ncbi:upstream binding transcription factor, RNA polymerase I specific, Hmo1 [Schizosaccharomyces osmophilus]|uniref:Upstream binding transcription factor, RNA polymerase I specific, Hmo1 n=1 Tax=Schizosaccharomyces osmophilus TaxID=2545709 RepID=A0AAE9W932_9SCHI|nr:upstream binding transcription factor, RNA polymerase I specific, Hmo1 [Schizosaccharomyces osmophilus]WBW71076.1 upstream binding transcription factor, RNA polymerase I specific, Hmo1 [Schizosaccharomyces osmophilus]
MAEEHGNLQKLSNSVSKLEDAFKLALGACQDIKEYLPILIAEKGDVSKPQEKASKNEKSKQTANKEPSTSALKDANVEAPVPIASAVPASSSVTEPVASASPTPSKRKARDPAQPKRPPTAYNLFQKNQRSEIKDSLGEKGNDVKEVNKAMHEKWTSLNENERKPFEEEASKLRETYDAEMTAFQATRESASSPAPAAAAEAEPQEGNQVAVSMPTTPASKNYVEFSETRPLAQASLSSPVTTSKKQNKKKRSSTNAPVEPQPQQEEGSATADKAEVNPSPSVGKRDKKKRRKSSVNPNNAPTATAASN